MYVSGSESNGGEVHGWKVAVRDGRKGNGLLEMVSGRGKGSGREQRTEKKALVAGTTCTYTDVHRGTRGRWRKRARDVEGICRDRRDSIGVRPVPLFGFQRIEFKASSSACRRTVCVRSQNDDERRRAGRTQSAAAERSDREGTTHPFRWLKVFTRSGVCVCLCI